MLSQWLAHFQCCCVFSFLQANASHPHISPNLEQFVSFSSEGEFVDSISCMDQTKLQANRGTDGSGAPCGPEPLVELR
ncbi:uncharacterized protein FOBCDRAFT_231617 [Fusarium oxysporum Fo47]|uniref:uncharacterized protein n=1 Tax=Fusarium oxysporum Fo47 TaxID=660027 RepID=UPI0028699BF2|nr:uncharacterized protein FOBCDRAFT_231617 [Fusarium oxysporum Fo47]WJG36134.1 hypothetical protein FOBCDRAFT_231617 [Fusarium oxysporum Fo47]